MKHIKSIDFTQDEAFFQGPMMAESDEPSPSYPINGMWFQEDGVTAKVGEPVTLTGCRVQLEPRRGRPGQRQLQLRHGQDLARREDRRSGHRLRSVPVGHLFPGLDAEQGGQVQVKLQATDVNGVQMKKPVTLFVNVEE